jgi:uncharacterized protein (TIGR01777 family)
MSRVIVTGGTGFIGRRLTQRLVEKGYEVICLTRNVDRAREEGEGGIRIKLVRWDAKSAVGWGGYAEGASAIVNLAGESLASGRWNKKRRRRILQSRLRAGKAVADAVKSARKKPSAVIQASAIGFYGNRGDEELDENSTSGTGFLPQVTRKWEKATADVEANGVRRSVIRTGLVLGEKGGALPRLALPFRFFLGGPLGSGQQWISWIHIEDEVKAIIYLMEHPALAGVFNLTAPHPLRNRDFSKKLGMVLKRPSWMPVPGFLLRLIFGQKAEETILSGQKVMPVRLVEAGYEFVFPEAGNALADILVKKS